jgi:hypothetical protein
MGMLGALRSLNFADSGCEDVLNAARASMCDDLHARLSELNSSQLSFLRLASFLDPRFKCYPFISSPKQIESRKALLES